MAAMWFFPCLFVGLWSICGCIGVPILQNNAIVKSNSSSVPRHRRSLTYEEMRQILARTLAPPSWMIEPNSRSKSNNSAASANRLDVLNSTINDHRTMINDHQRMIDYLINNTINITHLNQYYAEQHSKIAPHWRSWRDLSLLLLMAISACLLIYLIVSRLRLLERLASILLRHCEHELQAQTPVANQQISLRPGLKEKAPIPATAPVAAIHRDYFRYTHASDLS